MEQMENIGNAPESSQELEPLTEAELQDMETLVLKSNSSSLANFFKRQKFTSEDSRKLDDLRAKQERYQRQLQEREKQENIKKMHPKLQRMAKLQNKMDMEEGLSEEEKVEWKKLNMMRNAGLIGAVEMNTEPCTINPDGGQLMSRQLEMLVEFRKRINGGEELSQEEKVQREKLQKIERAGLLGAVEMNTEPCTINPDGGQLMSPQQIETMVGLQKKMNTPEGLVENEKELWRKLGVIDKAGLLGAVAMTPDEEQMPGNF